ncbi:MAG: TolC family protein [Bacteroidota bacterium]
MVRSYTIRAYVGALLSSMVLGFSASGAQSRVPRVLSLEEAVAVALRENHELAAARLEVEKADARVHEAWGFALPRLDLNARYSRALKKPVFFLPDFNDLSSGRVMPIEIGSTNSVDMTFSASQVLFNTAVFTGVGTARVYSQAARDVCRAREVDVVTGVRKAFYGAMLAAEILSVAQQNLSNAEANLRNVTLLASQGLVAEYDRLRASVGVENLRPEITRAENGLTLALNGLKLSMGLAINEPVEVKGSIAYVAVDSTILATAGQEVLASNPSLSALRHQEEVGGAIVAVERSNYLPSLAAFGTYELQGQKNDLRISTRDLVSSALVGVTLSVNLFNGLQTNARVEQAQLDMRKIQQQIRGLELQLTTGVSSALLQLSRIRQRIAAQEETIKSAERGHAIASTRYNSGSATLLEVNDARLALNQARLNLVQTHYDYMIAAAELDQLLGRLPPYVREAAASD